MNHYLRQTILTLACAAFLFTPASAQSYWKWTPKADHHQAAVRILCNGAGTSGVYLEHNGKRGVLTCAHSLSGNGEATVTFSDGTTQRGRFTVDKYNLDIGWVYVEHATLKPLELAPQAPARGSPAEFVTYGGPLNVLRHWSATFLATGDRSTVWFDTYVINGDSGGTILNSKAQVIGVQSVGSTTAGTFTHDGHTWDIYRNGGSAPFTGIQDFCGRVCPPRGYAGPLPRRGGVGGVYPPNNPPQQPQQPQQPPQEIEVEVDYDKLAELVVARMRENPEPFRGPAGQDGKNGKDGTPGQPGTPGRDAVVDYDKLAGEVQRRLPPIRVVREGGEGGRTSEDSVSLGGTLRLPPVRMEIQHPDGRSFYQEKPLGGTIAIKLVPKGR